MFRGEMRSMILLLGCVGLGYGIFGPVGSIIGLAVGLFMTAK